MPEDAPQAQDLNMDELVEANLRLQRARQREQQARRRAEELLEERSRQLYQTNAVLVEQNEALARRNAEVELLNDVVFFARDVKNLRSIMQRFLDAVCKKCGWNVGHAYVFSPRAGQLVSLKVWHLEGGEAVDAFRQATAETAFLPSDKSLPSQVYASGEPVWVEDILQHPSYPNFSFPQSLDIHFGYGIPINIYGRPVVVAEFYAPEEYEPNAADLNMVEVAAIQLGSALERQQAERNVKKNYRKLEKALVELKQTQVQLVQSEKMAGLGELSAGVAHEINTPVGYVMSNVRTLSRYVGNIKELFSAYGDLESKVESQMAGGDALLGPLQDLKEKFDLEFMLEDLDSLAKETKEGLIRIKEIIQGLQNFARTDESDVEEADINEGIEATLKIVWNDLKYKCEITKKLGDLPPLKCYAGQLNQVFLNLLKNAGQAIEEKGRITVISRSTSTHLVVSVADTGAGIPQENLSKLFDPFFTTKPVGEGTGLGLSISHGIVEKHGGTIEVESKMGKGTVFTVSLPLKTDIS
jgi:two-component system, NtrC family, sensor kinase